MLTTTTNQILSRDPCARGWGLLTGQYGFACEQWHGTDDVLTFQSVVETNGVIDAYWSLIVLCDGYQSQLLGLAKALHDFRGSLIDSGMLAAYANKDKAKRINDRSYKQILDYNEIKLNHAKDVECYTESSCYLTNYVYRTALYINEHVSYDDQIYVSDELAKILMKFANEEL